MTWYPRRVGEGVVPTKAYSVLSIPMLIQADQQQIHSEKQRNTQATCTYIVHQAIQTNVKESSSET